MSKKDVKENLAEEHQEEMVDQPDNTVEEDTSAEEALEISPEQEAMEKLRQEHGELKDKYLRLFAEFENYKKRTFKEKLELMKTAAQDTMSALLPVLDDFDRAKKNAEDQSTEEIFSEGVNLVYNKLYSVLKNKGLEAMESNGEVFDPELHEAITEIPAPTSELKGKIVDTIEKGYTLKDKIIRHAKVVTGK
ncbi:MAG: nucleotide exchange factor GrpE [Saprospiraceae bacterium]|nr:nucleotide exchange factor GrpE [Saprospiraceae bacterium]